MNDDTALAIWTTEERDIIGSVIAPGLTDPELRLFAQVCRATGLNPLMQQIHAIKRNAWNPQTRQSEPKLTIQTSIHGLRLIADRTKCYAPGQRPTFEYKPDGSLLSATAYVKKLAGGTWHEVEDTAYWDEYVQTNKDGKPIALWATKPHVMAAKCAEALALRRAFPAEMAGVYTDDEMPVVEPQPAAEPALPLTQATARELAGKPEPKPAPPPRVVVDAAADEKRAATEATAVRRRLNQELLAAMADRNMPQSQVTSTIRDLWGIVRSGDLSNDQVADVIAWVRDAKQLVYGPDGKAALVDAGPGADDGLEDIEALPFEVAAVGAVNG